MPKEIEFILKDFVRHVVDLKAEDDPAGTGFHREFRILREEQVQNKNEDRFSTEDGKREENLKKNRYKDILPRDDKRVKLTEIEGEKGSDYINASFIEDVNGENGYIAIQGPMPHTISDFWRMLWQYNTEVVFMLCKLKEDCRPKCEKYWADEGESATYGDITVHTESEEEIRKDFYKRQLRAEKDGEIHTLTQFHYVGWPDHNIPSSPDILRTMIEDVRNFRKHLDIPMVVHCSAGCGRTGTICAIDYAWTLLDRGMIKEEFSLFEIVKSMREERVSMVQTPDQYEYAHMVIKSLCNEWLAAYSNHDYENIIFGKPPSEEGDDEQELYVNVEFEGDNSQNGDATDAVKEKVIILPEAPREVEKLVTSSQPPRDDLSQLQENEEAKPRPEVLDHKPSRTPTMVIANSHQHSVDAGEYVEVSRTATAPPLSSAPQKPSPTNTSTEAQKRTSTTTSGASSSEPQKNTTTSSSGSNRSDVQKKLSTSSEGSDFDPHKTVIMVGGSNTIPKIIKSGSVGVSQTKQRAPNPSAAQAVVRPMIMSEQKQQQQQQQQQGKQQQTVANNVKVVEVVSLKTADRQKTEHQSSMKRASDKVQSDEKAPDLPSRNYKLEEISSPPSSPTSPSSPHLQEPVIVTTLGKPSSSSPPPSVDPNRDRLPQPVPTDQAPPSPHGVQVVSIRPTGQVRSSGQVVNARSSAQVVNARSSAQVVNARSSAQVVNAQPSGQTAQVRTAGHQSQLVPGMVSVMVGAQPQQQHAAASARPAAAKPFDTRSLGLPIQPVRVYSPNKGPTPQQGPMMMQRAPHQNSAGMTRHVVPAPVAGQVLTAKTMTSGKIVYMTERPPRVRGPQNMPAMWVNQGKKHRGGTYL